MQALQDNYPVFEANQVLTNAHLNQVFNYLDEQGRLTRANLIGIGIVCGLEIRLETLAAGITIRLGKGCGVTSEGYLILEPDNVALVAYRSNFLVPPEPGYAPFLDAATSTQYPLWELFPAGEPNVTALASPANFLQDKALLLFLELKQEDLRNCSPINCDDKGASVKVTVRRLLVAISDLAKIIAAANQLRGPQAGADPETALLARLNLPDLRLPRYNVPNTRPVTSEEVLAGFHAIFYENKLVQHTAAALTAAYQAFRPVVEPRYASNPFAGFAARFGFLDTAPTATAQVRFLQYYYDFFGDLLQAYEEFRWKGAELLCACCPDEDLFPRHLMVGVLLPESVPNPGIYRHPFLASAVVTGCEERTVGLEQLFRRLVEMVARFMQTPPLPLAGRTDEQIRIVPSKLADVPLSDKAIPYYYLQTGTPPLFQLWNAQRTRRNRANQNLSYRADEYLPAPPAFVTNPLRYDLEPYNFLRIEGHLGKSYQSALSTLLASKARHRLPIDIIALRTGAFNDKLPVDLTKESARFPDLETLYDTIREQIMTALAQGARFFYGVAMPRATDPEGVAQLPLLKKYAPGLRYQKGTVGAWFEKNLSALLGLPYIDVDQSRVNDNTIWTVFCLLFQHAAAPANEFYPHVVAVYYFSKLAEMLPPSLSGVGFAEMENKYEDLLALARYFRSEAAASFPTELAQYLPQEELIDQFDEVLYSAKLDPLRAVRDEYKHRLREVKQQQFLGYFLRNHPGIQHKAGVPMGGTFILVYHDDPDPVIKPGVPTVGVRPNANELVAQPQFPELNTGFVNTVAVSAALTRISGNEQFAIDPDIRLLLSTLTGAAPDRRPVLPGQGGVDADKIIRQTVDELADGTIIADFYLPYLLSTSGGVQFVLPKLPPTFTAALGCTNADQQAEVTLTPEGGMPPYSFKIDDGDFQPLKGSFLLPTGGHTIIIRDAEAAESAPQKVEVARQLALMEPDFACVGDSNQYVVTAQVSGGTPPYTASRGTMTENRYVSDTLPGNEDVAVTITDSRQCSITPTFTHSCLPSLDFTTRVGCTSSEQVAAQVEIVPTGGTAPYQVRVGVDSSFVPLAGTLSLAVGTHAVVVRDAAGAETPAQTVVVLPALALEDIGFDCLQTNSYVVTIRITGGLPPYTVGGQALDSNLLTTEPVASGTPVRVEVKDQNNCTAQLEVTHTCAEPCDLPCDGVSRRCAYRLWLQPPVRGGEYKAYRAENSTVTLIYNGHTVSLPAGLVAIPRNKLNNQFDDILGETIKKLNRAIAEAIGEGRVELEYRPSANDPFALLWIEHFVCETFSLSFDYVVGKPDPLMRLRVEYMNVTEPTEASFNGVLFVNETLDAQRTQVPAFDCVERNQCTHSPARPLCEEEKPRVEVNRDFPRFAGAVTNTREDDVIAWIWDFTGVQPSGIFSTGQTVQPNLGASGQARLTAITRKGCFGTTEVDYTLPNS